MKSNVLLALAVFLISMPALSASFSYQTQENASHVSVFVSYVPSKIADGLPECIAGPTTLGQINGTSQFHGTIEKPFTAGTYGFTIACYPGDSWFTEPEYSAYANYTVFPLCNRPVDVSLEDEGRPSNRFQGGEWASPGDRLALSVDVFNHNDPSCGKEWGSCNIPELCTHVMEGDIAVSLPDSSWKASYNRTFFSAPQRFGAFDRIPINPIKVKIPDNAANGNYTLTVSTSFNGGKSFGKADYKIIVNGGNGTDGQTAINRPVQAPPSSPSSQDAAPPALPNGTMRNGSVAGNSSAKEAQIIPTPLLTLNDTNTNPPPEQGWFDSFISFLKRLFGLSS